jgi:hypothetical protein
VIEHVAPRQPSPHHADLDQGEAPRTGSPNIGGAGFEHVAPMTR